MHISNYYTRFLFTGLFCLLVLFSDAKTDKYRCIWRANPATTMTIGWNLVSGKNPVVYFGRTDHGKNTSQYPKNKNPDKVVYSKGMNNHFARLTGLRPNTKYYFVVRDSEGTSKRFWFRTAPNNPYERLSMVGGGDSRNNATARKNANMLVAKLRPHCVLFGGDMTGGDNATQWKAWFNHWQLTTAKDGRMTPIIPARGNHEYSNQTLIDLFDSPKTGVYYALNFGGDLVRVYTLNSMISSSGNQKTWLHNDLERNKNTTWRLAQYHHPIRPHTRAKAEREKQRRHWATLFYDYQVQLVLESDAHTCKYTWPIRPSTGAGSDEGFVKDTKKGTVYVGEGGWGAPLRADNDDKIWTRNSGKFNQFKWIWIDQNKIEVRTVKTDNASSVSSLKDANIFKLPSGISIWKPSNGSVITITNRGRALASNTPTPKPAKKTKPKTKTKPKPIKKTKPKSVKKTKPKKTVTKPKPKPKPQVDLILGETRVTLEGESVKVRWQTLSEPSEVTCSVESSTDGRYFKTVANMLLNGGSRATRTYQIKDDRITRYYSPFVYYRVKYKRKGNDNYLLSKVQKVSVPSVSHLQTLRADTNGKVKANYKLLASGDVKIAVYAKNGEERQQRTLPQQKAGSYSETLDMSIYPKGTYFLKVQTYRSGSIWWKVEY